MISRYNIILVFGYFLVLLQTASSTSYPFSSTTTSTSKTIATESSDNDSAAAALSTYKLPAFSLILNVEKPDKSLIVFQDRLDTAVRHHLTDFFHRKVNTGSRGKAALAAVEKVKVSSSYVWKQLSRTKAMMTKYEVRSAFQSEIDFEYIEGNNDNSNTYSMSRSILDLLLVEAFQGDSYWELVHKFMQDTVLEDITGVKITVNIDGYVHYNGNNSSEDGLNTNDNGWTGGMTFGVVFATLLVISLMVVWTYICCCRRAPDTLGPLVIIRSILAEFVDKNTMATSKGGDNDTDDMHSTSTIDPQVEDGEEGKWMDAWAQSVTSIPLRLPHQCVSARRLKKKAAAIRHPAQHHNSYLNAIEEADDECSTVCSVDTMQTHRSKSELRPTANSNSNPKNKFTSRPACIDEEDGEAEAEAEEKSSQYQSEDGTRLEVV